MGVSPAAYARAINDIINERDRLGAAALAEVLNALRGAQQEIMARLLAIPSDQQGKWQYHQLSRARTAIEDVLANLGGDAAGRLAGAAEQAFALGAGSVSRALGKGGDPALGTRIAFGEITTDQAIAIARHYPLLVQGVTARAVVSMGQTIQRGLLTGKGAHAIMGELRAYLDVPERPTARFGGLAAQVQRVYVTEVNRIYAAGTEMGYARAVDILGLGAPFVRVWQHSGGGRWPRDMHVKLHGMTAPYPDGKFDVNGNPARFPHAPELPGGEVINCRCGALLWNQSWGPVDEFRAFPPGSDAETGRGEIRK